MSNITNRLRNALLYDRGLMTAAADEIERLQTALNGVLAICPWRQADGVEHPEITTARRIMGQIP